MIARIAIVFVIVFVMVYILMGVIEARQNKISAVVINKISSAKPDWIELYNSSDQEIDVGGLRLSDGENVYDFPSGITIQGEGTIIVARSKHQAELDEQGIVANQYWDEGYEDDEEKDWGFDADGGEFVILFSKNDAGTFEVIDIVRTVALDAGEVQERHPDGTSTWYISQGETRTLIQADSGAAQNGNADSSPSDWQVTIKPMAIRILDVLTEFTNRIATLLAFVVSIAYSLGQLKKHAVRRKAQAALPEEEAL